MSCLDYIYLPPCWAQEEEKRNAVASIISGLLFFTAWWIIIDVNVTHAADFNGAYHLCGIVGAISFFMVNSVSNSVLYGDGGYDGGCMGQQSARFWLFFGFTAGFASIIAACWILFAEYVAKNDPAHPISQWAGIGLFLQNCFIVIASLIYKFGRVDHQAW